MEKGLRLLESMQRCVQYLAIRQVEKENRWDRNNTWKEIEMVLNRLGLLLYIGLNAWQAITLALHYVYMV